MEHLKSVLKETYYSLFPNGDLFEYITLDQAILSAGIVIIRQEGKMDNNATYFDYQFINPQSKDRSFHFQHRNWTAQIEIIYNRDKYDHDFYVAIISPDGQVERKVFGKEKNIKGLRYFLLELLDKSNYSNWKHYHDSLKLAVTEKKQEDLQTQIDQLKSELKAMKEKLDILKQTA